jgi:signal peptidase II
LKNKSFGKLFITLLLILMLDQGIKAFVNANITKMNWYNLLYPYGGIGIFENFLGIQFSIVHETNKGAAWGSFADHPLALLVVRSILIFALIVYLVFSKSGYRHRFPLILIISGAIGNVIDIFLYSHVVDMFYFKFGSYSYPVFNVADSFIFIGIIWLLLQGFSKKSTA